MFVVLFVDDIKIFRILFLGVDLQHNKNVLYRFIALGKKVLTVLTASIFRSS